MCQGASQPQPYWLTVQGLSGLCRLGGLGGPAGGWSETPLRRPLEGVPLDGGGWWEVWNVWRSRPFPDFVSQIEKGCHHSSPSCLQYTFQIAWLWDPWSSFLQLKSRNKSSCSLTVPSEGLQVFVFPLQQYRDHFIHASPFCNVVAITSWFLLRLMLARWRGCFRMVVGSASHTERPCLVEDLKLTIPVLCSKIQKMEAKLQTDPCTSGTPALVFAVSQPLNHPSRPKPRCWQVFLGWMLVP